jgi:hypothetical protein
MKATVTVQEIYETEGFIIAASSVPLEKGDVFEPDSDGMGAGASLVVVGESTKEENDSFWRRYGVGTVKAAFFYKVMAE